MTLLGALATGLPLRRPISKHWGSNKEGYLGNQFIKDLLLKGFMRNIYYFDTRPTGLPLIIEEDLMATDWEVQLEWK